MRVAARELVAQRQEDEADEEVRDPCCLVSPHNTAHEGQLTVEREPDGRERRDRLRIWASARARALESGDTYVPGRDLRDHDERNGANANSERPVR